MKKSLLGLVFILATGSLLAVGDLSIDFSSVSNAPRTELTSLTDAALKKVAFDWANYLQSFDLSDLLQVGNLSLEVNEFITKTPRDIRSKIIEDIFFRQLHPMKEVSPAFSVFLGMLLEREGISSHLRPFYTSFKHALDTSPIHRKLGFFLVKQQEGVYGSFNRMPEAFRSIERQPQMYNSIRKALYPHQFQPVFPQFNPANVRNIRFD